MNSHLDLWEGKDVQNSIEELMDKLDQAQLSDVCTEAVTKMDEERRYRVSVPLVAKLSDKEKMQLLTKTANSR